ncbi:MAG: hypothetical protein WDN50_14270 [Bradyrhizobium sp.]
MPGIERKGALTTHLGVEMPSCLKMAKACGVERSGRVPASTVQSRLGFAGGYPAFVTVHRNFK